MQLRNRARPARDHLELGVESLEIEFADDRVMALLDQEPPRARLELLLDELELALGESKALDVFGRAGAGVREEDLGGRLLDDRAADAALQHITRALGRDRHHGIELAPGLGAILGKTLKSGIGEQAPELVHPAHEPSTVEEALDYVEEIQRDRRTYLLVLEKVRDIHPEERRPGQLSD